MFPKRLCAAARGRRICGAHRRALVARAVGSGNSARQRRLWLRRAALRADVLPRLRGRPARRLARPILAERATRLEARLERRCHRLVVCLLLGLLLILLRLLVEDANALLLLRGGALVLLERLGLGAVRAHAEAAEAAR
eukprot:3421707-Pyramimonas_sp.AAC.1